MSALAALAADATGAAVPAVDVAASAAASDDTAPADDVHAPTAPLIDAAEGTVPLVAGSAADIFADAAATADDAGAPPPDAAEGTVPLVEEAAVNAARARSRLEQLAFGTLNVRAAAVNGITGIGHIDTLLRTCAAKGCDVIGLQETKRDGTSEISASGPRLF